VDSAPCTTRVQEISYGQEEQCIEVSKFEEHRQLPHAILRHIAIVDTPGTNSIIREHQVITENYIPQSDLVLFVFFAKNPYTGSAWDFLHYIKHEWQRNTLFVLQQTDLLEARELRRTVSLVEQQLAERGIGKPVVFPVSVYTGEGLDGLREYLRKEVIQGRQFNKNISLTHSLLRFLRRFESALHDHDCLLEHDEALLGELRQLVVGLGPEADQEYATLAARARHIGEEGQAWLARQCGGANRSASIDKAQVSSSQRNRGSLRRRLEQFGLMGDGSFRDAASTGWETSLRIIEHLNQVHMELNRCLLRAQMRRLDLYRHLQRRLDKQLDAIADKPPGLTKPREDKLARQREETLIRARLRVNALGELGPEDPLPRVSTLMVLNRWSSFYSLAQIGAGVGSLVLGFHLDGLFTGLLLGLASYLGAGYALAAHSRARLGGYARVALEKSLAEVDRRLRETLLTQPAALRGIAQDTLSRFDSNLEQRRAQTEALLASLNELREAVKGFQSQAWVDAVEGEE
jgi:hypothetical protein